MSTEFLENAKNQPVSVYWWNFGTKTKDYEGTYQGFMDTKGVKVELITHPKSTEAQPYMGLRFTHDWGNAKFVYEVYGSDWELSFFNAIQMFLVHMGDRAKIVSRNRDVTVNKRD